MSKGNERFNTEAAAWDANPDVHRASEGALQAILKAHPELIQAKSQGIAETAGLDVLEIGCGTGLLSFRLAPYVRSIVAVDAAQGMIDALRIKLGDSPDVKNIEPLCVLLEDPEDPALPAASDETSRRKKFDLITSHLVLHHIPDLAGVLRTMYGCLKPGGRVALTDFEDFGPEARRFHAESRMAGVEHHGIKAEWFAGLMKDTGFEEIVVRPDWTMEKAVERYPGEWAQGKPEGEGVDLEKMSFPFLLCRGIKK